MIQKHCESVAEVWMYVGVLLSSRERTVPFLLI